MRVNKKDALHILGVFFAFLISTSIDFSSGWHIASEIYPGTTGTFASGNYVFPDDLNITDRICLNGECIANWASALSFTLNISGTQGVIVNSTGGNLTFSLNSSYAQRRVSSGCAIGSSIRVIDEDGTVTCETDSGSIDGSGTANYLAQFSDSDTLTDSIMFGNSDNVTVIGSLLISNSTSGNASGLLYLGKYNGAYQPVIYFDPTKGSQGKFVFGKPIEVPGASPAITFYDIDDPTNDAKRYSMVYDADTKSLSTGDAYVVNFAATGGIPQPNKVFFQIGNRTIDSPAGGGTYLGFNTPASFSGDLIKLQKNNIDRFRVTQNGDIVITGGTMTANAPILNTQQTWNNGAADFTAWYLNIANTASGSGSKLLDLRVDNTPQFFVSSDGGFTSTGTSTIIGNLNVTGTSYLGDFIIDASNISVNGDLVVDGSGNVITNILTSKDGNLTFRNSTGSEIARLTETGRLGIGTTTPSDKLHVSGAGDTALFVSRTGATTVTSYFQSHSSGSTRIGNLAGGGNITFSPNNNEMVRFTTNGNVGIGTTTPTQGRLVVANGNIASTYSGGGFYHSVANAGMYGVSGKLSITEWSNPTRGIVIDTTNGNVGMGTVTPDTTLQVVSSSTGDAVDIQGTGTGGTYLQLTEAGTKGWSIGIDDGSSIFKIREDNYAGATALAIDASGNVGIGTSSPTAKLTVSTSSDLQVDLVGANSPYIRLNSSANRESWIMQQIGNSLSGQGGLRFQNQDSGLDVLYLENNTGYVGIGTTTPVTTLDVRGRVSIKEDGTSELQFGTSGSSGYAFIEAWDGSSDRSPKLPVAINPWGGNVGIGTLDPQGTLQVGDDSSDSLWVGNNSAGTGSALITNGRVDGYYGGQSEPRFRLFRDAGGSGKAGIQFGDGGSTVDTELYREAANYLRTPDNLIVDGNIGIGTTSPQQKLVVVGDLNVTGSSYLSDIEIDTDNIIVNNITSKDDTINFKSSAGTERMRIDSSGNVGIGVTPTYKLDVNYGATGRSRYTDGTNSITFGLWDSVNNRVETSGKPLLITSYDGDLTLGIDGAANLVIDDATGNVGIGTASPSTNKLAVAGKIYAINSEIQAGTATIKGDSGYSVLGSNAGATGVKINTIGSGASALGITVIEGGNVGIGTSTPANKLDVAGVIRSGGHYQNVLEYVNGGIQANGIKIRTNIPFASDEFPTVFIEGYNYRGGRTLGLMVSWYGYGATESFISYSVSSYGGQTPKVSLANESGLVVIHLAGDKNDQYYERFNVRAYDPWGTPSWYDGWSAVDQSITGNKIVNVSYINRMGNLYVDGNLGVGTTSPEGNLHIYQGSAGSVTAYTDSDLVIESDNPNSFLSFLSPNTGNQGILFGDADANWRGQIEYYHPDDSMRIFTSASEAVRIDSSGNVGIGATSPVSNTNYGGLTLEGSSGSLGSFRTGSTENLRIGSNGASTGVIQYNTAGVLDFTRGVSGGTRVGGFDSSGKFDIVNDASFTGDINSTGDICITGGNCLSLLGGGIDGSGTANYIPRFSDSDTLTNSLIYDDGTNIGIGNSTPHGKFIIYGGAGALTSTFEIYTKQSGTSEYQPIFKLNPTGSTSNDGYLQILDQGVATISMAADAARGGNTYFNTGGKFGIGTSSVPYLLSVGDGTTAGDQAISINVPAANVANFDFSKAGVSKARIKVPGSSNDLWFTVGTVDPVLILKESGNVGIGTTTPGEKLEVVGDTNLYGDVVIKGNKKVDYFAGSTSYPSNFANRIVQLDTYFSPSSAGTDISINSEGYPMGHFDVRIVFSGNAAGSGVGNAIMDLSFDTSVNSAGNALIIRNRKLTVKNEQGGTYYGFDTPVNIAVTASGKNVVLTVAGASTYSTGLASINFKGDYFAGSIIDNVTTPGGGPTSTAWVKLNGFDTVVGEVNAIAGYTNNTARFRIDSIGRVGIGTVTPNGRLHVNESNSVQVITNTSGVVILI